MQTEVRATNAQALSVLQGSTGLKAVQLDLDGALEGLLPQYLVRWAMRALCQGGELTLRARSARDDMVFVGSGWPFQAVVQVAAKCTADMGDLIALDRTARSAIFKRHSPPLDASAWSAGVIFGGDDRELPLLEQCLASLKTQAELQGHGQITVCGPAAAAAKVAALDGTTEYLPFDEPPVAGRFLVGKKKNLLIRHARHERVLICHTRMALKLGALRGLPQEFDLITPVNVITGRRGDLPYLDLLTLPFPRPGPCSPGPKPTLFYDRRQWLQRLRSEVPYIDGGLFCVRRSLALAYPLSESIAWGESEDLEWCSRLMGGGYLVELSPTAGARSLTCKTPGYQRWGHSSTYRAAACLKRCVQRWMA